MVLEALRLYEMADLQETTATQAGTLEQKQEVKKAEGQIPTAKVLLAAIAAAAAGAGSQPVAMADRR